MRILSELPDTLPKDKVMIKTDKYNFEITAPLDYLVLDRLWVKPSHRKQGIASEILISLQRYNTPITLHCWPTLVRFYKKRGFEIVHRRDEQGYVEMINYL